VCEEHCSERLAESLSGFTGIVAMKQERYALKGQCNFEKLPVSSMVRRRITTGLNRLRAAVMSVAYATATPVPSGLVLSRPSPSAVLVAHPNVIRTD